MKNPNIIGSLTPSEILQRDQQEKENLKKYELLKEVAEANLKTFCNEFNSTLFNYRALNTNFINRLTEEEVRQLGVNFFTKMVAKASYKNNEFYFDKKLTVKN